MKLIVPMAGRGTRLRPHTHVTPKPLLPVVGRTMVERIVETFAEAIGDFEEAVFVLGDPWWWSSDASAHSGCEGSIPARMFIFVFFES